MGLLVLPSESWWPAGHPGCVTDNHILHPQVVGAPFILPPEMGWHWLLFVCYLYC